MDKSILLVHEMHQKYWFHSKNTTFEVTSLYTCMYYRGFLFYILVENEKFHKKSNIHSFI